ncbi:Eukaryotic protein of unknown function (DUF2003) [Nesidiocoris tenuis]|uniref:DH domain-containing protein n=1 Tax=Nesidiocoris tenuis TaxID=355587 RepID=A0ABN7AIW9_9HEMI|nr:Eukaryotic protein of unknown function (DUF2003) [Nesidiocoris tenuis]
MEEFEKVLSDFFFLVSTFCYDKAKEMLEKERVTNRLKKSFFMQLLIFCEAEKTYYNLGFLSTKTKIFVNLRKDSSLRAMYDGLRIELHRLEGLPSPSSDPVAQAIEKTVTPIANQLCHFSTARLQLIDLYEKIYNLGIGTKHIKYDDLMSQVGAITQMHVLPHPLIASIRSCITWECESLMHCLGAQCRIEEYTMMPVLMHLHTAHNRLLQWEKSIQVKESWKIGFLKSQYQPLLFQWLGRLRNHLVNKFTLYFYSTLTQQSTMQDVMSHINSKNNTDLYVKLRNLHKRTIGCTVALMFDPRGLTGWKDPGYVHPGRSVENPPDQYVVMLSHPVKITERIPGICRALDCRTAERISPEKTYFFYNSEEKCSYVLWSIEPRVSLVVSTEGKRDDKTNVAQFAEFCAHVRGTPILASLKPSK